MQCAIWLLFGALLAYLLRLPDLRDLEVGGIGWCVFHLFMLGGFVRRSWFGVNWREHFAASRTRQVEVAKIPVERGQADQVRVGKCRVPRRDGPLNPLTNSVVLRPLCVLGAAFAPSALKLSPLVARHAGSIRSIILRCSSSCS